MAVEFQVDVDRQLTVFRKRGKVQAGEIIEALNLYSAGEMTRDILWDLRHTEPALWFNADDILAIVNTVQRISVHRTGGRTAVVAPDSLNFGLSRMYAANAECRGVSHSIQVFRLMEEALEWLQPSTVSCAG